jgi:hypothetical protein
MIIWHQHRLSGAANMAVEHVAPKSLQCFMFHLRHKTCGARHVAQCAEGEDNIRSDWHMYIIYEAAVEQKVLFAVPERRLRSMADFFCS